MPWGTKCGNRCYMKTVIKSNWTWLEVIKAHSLYNRVREVLWLVVTWGKIPGVEDTLGI